MRSSTLVLLFLISVQAAINMGEDAPRPPTHHHQPRHHHQHHSSSHNHQPRRKTDQQSQSSSQPQPQPEPQPQPQPQPQPKPQPKPHSHSQPTHSRDAQHALIPTVDPKLFNKRRYRSPRVLFSDSMPPDGEPVGLATERGPGGGQRQGPGRGPAGVGGWDRGPRIRRRAEQFMHRGEYSVCDSENHWVGNMTRATDMAGNEVTVLPDVRINNVVKKQLFYETTCRVSTARPIPGGGGGGGGRGRGGGNNSRGGNKSGASSSGCRGIDSRYWNSYCTNTHTYVRALTTFNNQIAWRLIRINAACVCVLSRRSWRG